MRVATGKERKHCAVKTNWQLAGLKLMNPRDLILANAITKAI